MNGSPWSPTPSVTSLKNSWKIWILITPRSIGPRGLSEWLIPENFGGISGGKVRYFQTSGSCVSLCIEESILTRARCAGAQGRIFDD